MAAHILIVDDSRDILMLLHTALTRSGYRVSEATNGEEAIHQLEQDLPDLVVSDIMMPGMDGFELLARIRADGRLVGLPVIFLTAAGNAEVEERARSLGVEHFLDKPVSTRRLLATVQGTLERFAQLRSAGRLRAATSSPVAWDAVPSGIDPLDDLTGGLPRGRTYYLSGDVGAGKTPFVVQYVHWALSRGEGAVLVTTDRPSILLQMARGLGFALEPFLEQDRLALLELAAPVGELLEQPADLRAMVADLRQHAEAVQASRIAIVSALTVLGGSPGLDLTAPLVSSFLRELEDAAFTTLLVGDQPATPAEQLAEAFLRRSTFGSVRLTRHAERDDVRVLTVERLLGTSIAQNECLFRVETGVGLVAVEASPVADAALPSLQTRLSDSLAHATREQRVALITDPSGKARLHDRWAMAMRDCVQEVVETHARCAVLVARLSGVDEAAADALRQRIGTALGPNHVAHWSDAGELVVFGVGADRTTMERLAADVRAQARSAADGEGITVESAVAGFSDRATAPSILQSLRRLAPRPAGLTS